jgi:hypothetical protein
VKRASVLGQARPFASLTSGLLARKGQARPAMRPQGFDPAPAPAEDLGWNDMGEDEARSSRLDAPAPAVPIAVHAQQDAIAREFSGEPDAEPGEVPGEGSPAAAPAERVSAEPVEASVVGKARTAFTLRLDRDRHLRLRLACTARRMSAQRLVTEAVDRLLADHPELDQLASNWPPSAERA